MKTMTQTLYVNMFYKIQCNAVNFISNTMQ